MMVVVMVVTGAADAAAHVGNGGAGSGDCGSSGDLVISILR